MRLATPTDQAGIEAFLDARLPYVMFPRTNLADYGLQGTAPYASRYWLTEGTQGITDLLALSNNGVVQPCLPSADYVSAARILQGCSVSALVGPLAQVRGLMGPLGLAKAPRAMDSDEPHFLLSLDALTIPEGGTHLIPMRDAPLAVLRAWFTAYERETLNTPPDRIEAQAAASLARSLARDAGVVLMHGDTPVAMTGFNAILPQAVQVGGVYTPPELRGQCYARRAVALHLQQARDSGVQQATLFSANETASKAYRAIGFRQIGEWSVVLLSDPKVIHAKAVP